MQQILGATSKKAIKIARKVSKRSQHTFAYHAVVVIRGGAVVATGYNHDYVHAEINALNQLWLSERRGCKVWSIRVTKGGKLANAKPCIDCEEFIFNSGIKTVWYSDEHGDIVRLKNGFQAC